MPETTPPTPRPRILLSNDDGYQAPGLLLLSEELARLGRIVVVAPDRDRSGASNSLTLDRPLRVRRATEEFHYVNGTPADCVHLAITSLLKDDPPDMVLSGINAGANLGDDVIYSGTVAAAMEGRFLGCTAVAVSLVEPGNGPERHYASAGYVAARLVRGMRRRPLKPPVLLNVNVPNLPIEELRGFALTRLGQRHRGKDCIVQKDPQGNLVYWIGSVGDSSDDGPGTDFHAVAGGRVSITPLQVDLTQHAILPDLKAWLERLRLDT